MKHRVSPEGSISISGVGPVSVAGLTIEQAQQRIQSKVDRIMSGQVRVSLGEIRSIKVNISGEVAVPGTYTLPSLATVFNAIYSAGGVNDIGSLRRIQVYRNSRKVADLDVYDYLVNGKYETNILLEDNDMIIVPPYDSYVAIGGKVKRERIYELKKGETLGKLIEYAGGFTGDAYAERLTVYRKSGRQRSLVTVEKADLDAFPMMDGDSLHVDVVLPTYSNMLTIRGAVWRPGDYELGPDVRTLSQLIAKAEGLRGSEFASRGQISRFDSTTSIYTVIPFVVSDVASGRTDVELRNRDEVYIPNVFDLREDYSVTVRGEVNAPQTLDYRDGMTVEDVIVLCGGLRESASGRESRWRGGSRTRLPRPIRPDRPKLSCSTFRRIWRSLRPTRGSCCSRSTRCISGVRPAIPSRRTRRPTGKCFSPGNMCWPMRRSGCPIWCVRPADSPRRLMCAEPACSASSRPTRWRK